MASIKYTRLPLADDVDDSDSRRLTFDYSSAFTFEERDNFGLKYKSAFTYGNEVSKLKASEIAPPSNLDRLAKFCVLVGYLIVYVFTFPVMVWFSFKKIPHDERLVVFRLGHLHKMKGPGFVFLFPVLDRCHTIDVRLKAFSVPPKQLGAGEVYGGTCGSSWRVENGATGSDKRIWLILITQGKGENQTATGTIGLGTLLMLLKMSMDVQNAVMLLLNA